MNSLAQDIVDAIVNGAEPDGLSIAQIIKNIPENWNEQQKFFGFPERFFRLFHIMDNADFNIDTFS